MNKEIEQMTLRVKIDFYNSPADCSSEFVNFFPDYRLKNVEVGMRVGKNIFVNPEVFSRLISKHTFHETISGLLITAND